MAENSKIEWTDHTFNPWIGCSKVSAGCKNCYAETLMDKRYGRVQWGDNGTRVRTSDANWRKPLTWAKKARATGTRPRVFCSSLADVFEDRPELEVWRDDLFQLIADTPELDWLILTKRPENIERMMNPAPTERVPVPCLGGGDYLPNVWLGTSVEDQSSADKRIPELLKVPARVRFLSVEPLLGPVDFEDVKQTVAPGFFGDCLKWYHMGNCHVKEGLHYPVINWVIVGGESGPGARPMDPAWGRSIRDQCREAGVPFFMKQMDKVKPIPDDLMIRQFPEVTHG